MPQSQLSTTMSGAGVHADEEKQAFLSLPGVPDHAATVVEQRNSKLWSYGRLALEVIMAAAIVLFLVRSPSTRKFREDMSSPVPTCMFRQSCQFAAKVDRCMLQFRERAPFSSAIRHF